MKARFGNFFVLALVRVFLPPKSCAASLWFRDHWSLETTGGFESEKRKRMGKKNPQTTKPLILLLHLRYFRMAQCFLKVCKEKWFKVTVQHIDEVEKGDVDSPLRCLWLLMANLCSFITLNKLTSERFCKAVGITVDKWWLWSGTLSSCWREVGVEMNCQSFNKVA